MIFKRYEWLLFFRTILLFAVLLITAWVVLKHLYIYLVVLVPVIIYQFVEIISAQKKIQNEINQFIDSVNSRDFSTRFDEKRVPHELKSLRKKFNEVNNTFKIIRRERETQYHYLQKILELVDTGILSYQADSGHISWMNESFKKLLNIPYLKSIHALEKRDENLYNEIIKLRPDKAKVITINRNQQVIKLLVTASVIQIDATLYKLFAFQNVSNALDETETLAWQKLLSVMTHEIMNSVAPISSLADTLMNRLQDIKDEKTNLSNQLEDLNVGIDTIKRRSDGLLKFTESYRNLHKITKPDLKMISVNDLFTNIYYLMQPTVEKKGITLHLAVKDPTMVIEADLNLMEQMLINLLINAIEAVKNNTNPIITLSAEAQSNQKPIIKIADNGIGIADELLDKIFIPFFSTHKTGSGIGLSLCKQIMLLHKGHISVQSIEGKGSVFTLVFPIN